MITLSDYLRDSKTDVPTFADRIGVNRQSVYRYLRGETVPRKAVMEKIISVTKGKVTADSFFALTSRAA